MYVLKYVCMYVSMCVLILYSNIRIPIDATPMGSSSKLENTSSKFNPVQVVMSTIIF